IAVHEQMESSVLVLDNRGSVIGRVDASPVGDLDMISVGRSRRVIATNAYQETFQLGSPSLPQTAAFVRTTAKSGAAFLSDGRGVVAKNEGGDLQLQVVTQTPDHTSVTNKVSLGKGDAARIVGVANDIACARIEHAGQDANGAITTKRE